MYQLANLAQHQYVLQDDRVDLWLLPHDLSYSRLDYLDNKEHVRWQQLRSMAQQQQFLLSHSVLRYLLAAYCQVSYKDICYQYTALGKPFLRAFPRCHFSLSHAKDYSLIGIGMHPVGVDIELLRGEVQCLALARRFFPRSEYQALLALADQDRRQAFFELWTTKEAWSKVHALGLYRSLADCELILGASKQILKILEWPATQCLRLAAPKDYKASVAIASTQVLQLEGWTLQTLSPLC